MSDLVIQSPGGAWLNICGSEWKVLQDDGKWYEIDPLNDLRVRHGSNDYWMVIDCDTGAAYCPPEDIAECWSGYSGNFDSSEFKTGGVTGYLVCDCDGNNCKTYTGHGPNYDIEAGRFAITAPKMDNSVAYPLPATVFGHEAEITETLLFVGDRSGHVSVSLLELDTQVRVRIYHGCDLLGDSEVSGTEFDVFFNAEPPEMTELDCGVQKPVNNFLTMRVDAPAGSRWRVKVGAANVTQTTNYSRPAPCFGTFGPHLPCFIDDENRVIPGEAVYEVLHTLPEPGRVDMDLTINGAEPVTFSVFYNGGLIATTTTQNSGANTRVATTLSFNFTPVGGDDFIVVRYSAPRQFNSWTYSIYCPNKKGSRINPMFCTPVPDPVPYDVLCRPLNESLDPIYAIVGKGAPVNDMYYDYSGKLLGDIVVEYFATDAVQFLFYQGNFPNETLLSGTSSVVAGHNRFYFRFNPAFGTTIHVRTIGPCCPDWAYTMSCPVPPPVLNIYDAEIVRGRKGQTSYLCFTVELENKTPKRVTFDWDTSPITALVSTDGTCTITETVPDSPYCNIVATGSVQTASYQNYTNIGYPQAQQINSTLHNPNCAVGGQYYVMETELELPYEGTYTMVATADDNMVAYMDCKEIFRKSSTWEHGQAGAFSAKQGWQTLSIVYQNVPNCTPGWAKFVILNNAGQVIHASNASAYTWRSKVGTISPDPPPVAITYGADYNQVRGSGAIEACTKSTQICVPICGTDLMGPDVTFAMQLSNVINAEIGDLYAIGTIKNSNYYECDQATQVAVLDAGPNPYVNRGARSMYVNKYSGNPGASYVMDATINIPASGLYTFYFFGADAANLYMDCNLIAQSGGAAVKIRAPMNAGPRKFYINYWTAATNAKRAGYAAVVIVDSLNRIVYASNAAHWRGRILNPGNTPSCNQFATSCLISGNSIQQQQSGGGGSTNYTVGYGSVQVRSSLHSDGHQPNGINYSLQYTPTLPAGTYTVLWTCDDQGSFYVNCNLIRNKTSSWRPIDTFQFTHGGGPLNITVIYRNTGGNVTWCNWAILNSAGQPVSVSGTNLPGAASAVGDVVAGTVGVPLYNTWYNGSLCLHISPSIGSGGPNYNWWSAELDWNVPGDGVYYVVGAADDQLGLYIGCEGKPLNGTPFYLDGGPTKIHIRCYNLKSKNPNYCYFNIYNAAGGLVYQSNAAGWKAKWSDLDFSGLS
jgi:hypothetical protein